MIFFDSPQAQKGNARSGFTLLLAALVAAIVLSLGASIFTIARKQITLSSLGRDSQFAFYAADTIAECALYYDVRNRTTTGFTGFATSTLSPVMSAVTCDGVTVTPTLVSATANTAVTSFRIYSANGGPLGTPQDGLFSRDEAGNLNTTGVYCAEVTISKNAVAPYTVIHADGYSTPCSTLTSNARTLQRSIELQY